MGGGDGMLKTYLMDNYGYNEPIFLNDLKLEGLSENAVRQSVKRLVANGFLERYITVVQSQLVMKIF